MGKVRMVGRILAIALVLVVFGVMVKTGVVCANDEGVLSIKSSSEIITLVNEQYIPNAVQAMKNRLEMQNAEGWEGAEAGKPILQYWLNEGGNKVEPHWWIVPIQKDDDMVGFMGVDPYDGEFVWRISGVDRSCRIQQPADSIFEALVELKGVENDCDISKVKLALVRNKQYWLIPSRTAENVNDAILIDYDILGAVKKLGSYSPELLDSIRHVTEIIAQPSGGFKPEADEGLKGPQIIKRFSQEITENIEQHAVLGYATKEWSKLGGTSYTWMNDKIPYYKQDCDQWCWAACLAMMHQWWSPAKLGNSYHQEAEEIVKYKKGSIVCDGATINEMVDVLKNWDKVDNNRWDGDGVAYEDWVTADGGTDGKNLVQSDDPTGYFNDPKSWIYYASSPVLLAVDTDGDENANHAILLVGYDDNDSSGVAFINDPWYSDSFVPGIQGHNYEIAVSYDYLNGVWTQSGWWSEERLWACGNPGGLTDEDSALAATSISLKNCPSTIYDDEEASITIEMDISGDNTAFTTPYFGEWAESGVHVRTSSSDGVTGNGVIGVDSKGGFKSWTGYVGRNGQVVCDSSSSSTGEAKIFEFYTDNNGEGSKLSASFRITPTAIGSISLYYRSWVYDWDNRVHFSDTSNDALWITVLDDRGGDDTDFTMPKPFKYDNSDPGVWLYRNYLDIYSYSKTITVQDDDTTGPTYSNLQAIPSSPVYDSYSGSIRLQGDIWDPSGILDVKFMVPDESGGGVNYYDPSGSSVDASGNGIYWYDVPRSVWIKFVGYTYGIEWRIKADDADNDRPNDSTTSWSDWQKTYVQDDDTAGSLLQNPWATGNINDSFPGAYRVQIDASDPSGISTVKFAYGFDGTWSDWYTYSGHSGNTYWYDIPRSVWIEHIGQTVYWWAYAEDNDADRPGDMASTTSDEYTGGSISDDDTEGPIFTAYADSGDAPPGTYYFKVKLSDPKGIKDDDTYPRIYYRWDSSAIDGSNYDGHEDSDWDGEWYSASISVDASKVGHTIYWRAYAGDNDNSPAFSWGDTQTGGIILGGDSPPSSTAGPVSPYWHDSVPIDVSFAASDDKGLSSIALYYRYSSDTASWGGWTPDGSQSISGTSDSGEFPFGCPNGEGYYEFYTIATDNASQSEAAPPVADASAGYDATPPPNPTSPATETHGVADDTWQTDVSDPAFTWSQPSDDRSGIDRYYIYWGPQENGTSDNYVNEEDYDPGPVEDGSTNYLRVRAEDNAGNLATDWVTLFTFRYGTQNCALTVTSDGCCPIDVQYLWCFDPWCLHTVPAGQTQDFNDIPCGMEVTLSADDSAEDCDFIAWTVDGQPVSGNPINVTMDSDHTAIATCGAGVTVSIDAPDEVAPGSDFTANVTVDYVENFNSCGFNVTYDETIITVTDVTGGEIDGHTVVVGAGDWSYIPPGPDLGKISVTTGVAGAPAPGVTGTGYIAQIHFTVVGSPCQTSAIHLEGLAMYDYLANRIDTTTEDDSVQVSQPAIAVTVEPASKVVSIGKIFAVDIKVTDGGAAGVNSAGAHLDFDTTYLEALGITPGTALGDEIQNDYDNTAGTIDYIAGVGMGNPAVTGDFVLATVEFHAKAATPGTALSFVFTPVLRQTSVYVGFDNVLDPAAAINGNVNIVACETILDGHVDLQGRSAAPHASWITGLTVNFLEDGVVVRTETGTTDNVGNFTISDVQPGVYDICVKSPHALSELETGVVMVCGTTTSVGFGILREGDANGDDAISLADYALLYTAYGSIPGDANWNDNCDFNRNEAVDLGDYALLYANFGETGDLYVP
jgi:hypothetical protein